MKCIWGESGKGAPAVPRHSAWNVVEPLSLGAAFDMPAVFDPYWNLPPEHTQKNHNNLGLRT